MEKRPKQSKPEIDKGERHEGPEHSSPYPVERMAPAFNLVDLAQEIEKADQMVSSRVNSKLEVIAEQIKALRSQAEMILEQGQRDLDLNNAQCNFVRQPGKIYHLYARPTGQLYFSMLSPEDWRGDPPHTFKGSYKLEGDYSWTPVEQTDQPDESRALVERLLSDKGL